MFTGISCGAFCCIIPLDYPPGLGVSAPMTAGLFLCMQMAADTDAKLRPRPASSPEPQPLPCASSTTPGRPAPARKSPPARRPAGEQRRAIRTRDPLGGEGGSAFRPRARVRWPNRMLRRQDETAPCRQAGKHSGTEASRWAGYREPARYVRAERRPTLRSRAARRALTARQAHGSNWSRYAWCSHSKLHVESLSTATSRRV